RRSARAPRRIRRVAVGIRRVARCGTRVARPASRPPNHDAGTRSGPGRDEQLMRRWAIVNTLLGIIVALVGFEIVRTWARGLPRGAPPESAASTAPAPSPAPEPREKGKRGRGDKAAALAQQTPALLVAAIGEKDLFDPSRRPPTVEETTVATVPVTKPPDNVT